MGGMQAVPFRIKQTKQKTKSVYKTLYLSETLADQVQQLAKENETSFNNVLVSMIEYCLQEKDALPLIDPAP